MVKSKRIPSKRSGFSATATTQRRSHSYSPPARFAVKSVAPAIDSTSNKVRGRGWNWGLTEGLALDLLIWDGAREVEVVHLLLGRLLLMGLRRRGSDVSGSMHEGRRGRRVCRRRWRRGTGLTDGGAHGGSGGACD